MTAGVETLSSVWTLEWWSGSTKRDQTMYLCIAHQSSFLPTAITISDIGIPLFSGLRSLIWGLPIRSSACRKCNKDFNVIFARSRKCQHCGAHPFMLQSRTKSDRLWQCGRPPVLYDMFRLSGVDAPLRNRWRTYGCRRTRRCACLCLLRRSPTK